MLALSERRMTKPASSRALARLTGVGVPTAPIRGFTRRSRLACSGFALSKAGRRTVEEREAGAGFEDAEEVAEE